MNTIKTSLIFFFILFLNVSGKTQVEFSESVIVGAQQIHQFKALLKGKKVALAANQTSTIGQTHLADSLINVGVDLQLVFCPEHGFRGKADAGEKVENSKDIKTGLPIISLYGKHKKPTAEDLKDIDIVLFDIQDVGVRFYTYISTLHYIMEACAEQNIEVLVLDRPNPNGFYVDGPVLEEGMNSFVGMHQVPLVHGMTIGEYAQMVNGEKWLNEGVQCKLEVIPCKNYDHTTLYDLPVKPSPNLPNIRSVLLYPALGLFEGTLMSIGRGTSFPFQVYGHPKFKDTDFSFTPESIEGARYPKHENLMCKGVDLRKKTLEDIVATNKLDLSYLLDAYSFFYGGSTDFFNNFFQKLAGTKKLQNQIENRLSEEEIRASWQDDITRFKETRKKYLLYPDFE